MTRRTRRSWKAWVGGGSVAMAVLAVLSLGATVFFAQRALHDAEGVIARGEGDALAGAVLADLAAEGIPPSSAQLEQELKMHAAAGLRYLAVLERDGKEARAEAGSAKMKDAVLRPGQSKTVDKRIRLVGPIFGPRRPRTPLPAESDAARPVEPIFPAPFPGAPPGARLGFPLALLALEFEPPVVETLHRDLTHISIVAAIAGTVLLAFAFAWSRSANRLFVIEQRAIREQRLVALGSMSSVMAHELRNPLASLKGHAQLLAEDLSDPKQRAKVDRVVFEAERLEQLTTSLLDFVRDGPIELVPTAPAELIKAAVEHLDATRIRVDVQTARADLSVDAVRLARAVHNVVDNALQAHASEAVDLRIADEGVDVVIEVRDRGPGLPHGAESQIFEPFITTRVRGTGLGLAVARRIAEQHGGTLTGSNHPDGGAVFRLRFPVLDA